MFSSLNVTPAELWQMLLTHLWLSGLALLAAVAIAVPAAVLFARRRRAAEAVLQFTNILGLLRKYSSHRINQSCNQICP